MPISLVGLLYSICLLTLASSALAIGPSVPARFVRDIEAPGYADVIERPSAMHYDRFHEEILVADSGRNRVLIFQTSGVFKFEFDLAGVVTSPRDLTVDPEGYIYIIGSTPEGPAFHKFDFDGTPLTSFMIPVLVDSRPVELRYLACDDQGLIHALDHAGKRVLVYDALGDVVRQYPLGDDQGAQSENLAAFGSPSFHNGDLLVPIGNDGTVLRYGPDGSVKGNYGTFGNKPGNLIFPVAVESSAHGIVMVLDRSRYCVVCFTEDGRFLGEFGGRGFRAGWFLGPFLLAVPADEKVVVGQIFRSRIQVCALPRFIRDGALDSGQGSEGSPAESEGHASVGSPSGTTGGGRNVVHSGVESPSPEPRAHHAHNVTLSEVSQ